MDKVFFDLETQDAFGEDRDFKGLRMSVGVIFKEGEYRAFMEDEVLKLINELFSAELVVGFNLFSFDYKVLKGYTEKDLFSIPTLDMLREAQKALGFRISLDNLAKANLKKEKKGSGLDAIKWWKEGNIPKLIEYCKYDVEITKKIYELGKKQGFLCFTEKGGKKRQFNVKW
ncbi:MAG: ribonuclease H-like domain-containing protein [bacterium]